MYKKYRRIWSLTLAAIVLLAFLTTLFIGQPPAAKAAGRVPVGLEDYELWFG